VSLLKAVTDLVLEALERQALDQIRLVKRKLTGEQEELLTAVPTQAVAEEDPEDLAEQEKPGKRGKVGLEGTEAVRMVVRAVKQTGEMVLARLETEATGAPHLQAEEEVEVEIRAVSEVVGDRLAEEEEDRITPQPVEKVVALMDK
jgi:hypothetical protein